MTMKRKALLIILAALLLILILELVFRPHVLLNSLGRELLNLKRYESAEKLFARNQERDDAVAAGNLAKSRYKNGNYTEAASASEEALAKDPQAAALHYDRGNIAFQQEDYQAAIRSYEEALLADPRDEDVKANLELALRKLDENPPPPEPDKDESEEEQRSEEELRNILEALDNLEARDRKNQNEKTPPKTQNWW